MMQFIDRWEAFVSRDNESDAFVFIHSFGRHTLYINTLCLKKTSPTFLAITRESIDRFL